MTDPFVLRPTPHVSLDPVPLVCLLPHRHGTRRVLDQPGSPTPSSPLPSGPGPSVPLSRPDLSRRTRPRLRDGPETQGWTFPVRWSRLPPSCVNAQSSLTGVNPRFFGPLRPRVGSLTGTSVLFLPIGSNRSRYGSTVVVRTTGPPSDPVWDVESSQTDPGDQSTSTVPDATPSGALFTPRPLVWTLESDPKRLRVYGYPVDLYLSDQRPLTV